MIECAHLSLSVDQQLPDRQAADCEAGKIHTQHPYDQHWSSSGLCYLLTALLPVEKSSLFSPLCSPPLTIMNSTVTAVESFRFLGTTISQDLKWDNHIDSIVKKGPAEAVLPSPAEELQELIQPATGAAETVTLCHY